MVRYKRRRSGDISSLLCAETTLVRLLDVDAIEHGDDVVGSPTVQPVWRTATIRTASVILVTGGLGVAIGNELPIVGAPVVAIVLGIAVALTRRLGDNEMRVASLVGKYLLQAAIVVFGGSVSLATVGRIGWASLPVMLTSLGAAFAAAWALGRLLGVPGRLSTLIGVGTGICGASAIGAISPIIGATQAEIAYSVSTIFAFNVAAVLLFPVIGHLAGFGQHEFGLWAGTAVNDTSSVVAVAYSYGHAAGQYALLVKLARTAMIIPTSVLLLVRGARRRGTSVHGSRLGSSIPWFLLLFCLSAAANTFGLFGASAPHVLGRAAVVAFTFALAAVGISARPGEIRRTGMRPLFLGAGVWLVVATTAAVVGRLHVHLP